VQRLDRPFLHAERLAITHPRDGHRMEFTAPLPDDLVNILEALPGWEQVDTGGGRRRGSGRPD